MPAPELLLLRSVKTGKGLQKLIRNLQQQRKDTKISGKPRKALNGGDRKMVLDKTNEHCHLCGAKISASNFHADHVVPHSKDGDHDLSNYLPSCAVCNHLRWHYSPEELQLILRLGRWLKTELVKEEAQNLELANRFVQQLMKRRKERKTK